MTATFTKSPAVLPPITCPEWCTASTADHLEDLHEFEGRCMHVTGEREFSRLDDSRPTGVRMSTVTWFDGSPSDEPLVDVDGVLYTLPEAQRMALHILELVQVAQATA